MLKIAAVTEEGRFGGPQRWIATVSGKLKQFGIIQIAVFPFLDADRLDETLSRQGAMKRRISLYRPNNMKGDLIKFALLFFPETYSLYKLFKEEDIDMVDCNHSWQFKGVIAGKLAGKKVVWHLHETSTPFFINIIFRFLAKNFADAFITAGETVRAYYLKDSRLAAKPTMEIQAPVDTSVFDPERVVADPVISSFSGLKIVTVGNINPVKGIEYFAQMASFLNEQYDDLKFFVVGAQLATHKSYTDKIQGIIRDLNLKNLYLFGSSDDIPSILKAADIYVCSSIAEASPMSLWEAMSMEKGIVSTDVGDVARFIADGESGYIVPAKNVPELVKKVGLLIKNADLRKRIGTNARKIAIENLDVGICVKKHVAFYRKIGNQLK